MKNGTTRLAYKAEHAVDLESDLIVSATMPTGIATDTETVIDTSVDAAANLEAAGSNDEVKTVGFWQGLSLEQGNDARR